MEITINQFLTNGMIGDIESNPRIVGFMVGAIDKGFTVHQPGVIFAKYNAVTVKCYTGKDVNVEIANMSDGIIRMEIPLSEFNWGYVTIYRGALYYDEKFVCKTTRK